jgi:hypothetical protein
LAIDFRKSAKHWLATLENTLAVSQRLQKTRWQCSCDLENALAKLASDFSEIWANSKVIGKM